MKEVIIILTRQVLILRACGERWLQKRKESCKRERRSNTESKHRWHVKGENYGKAIPTVFHSFHSPEPEILSSIENVNFGFFPIQKT